MGTDEDDRDAYEAGVKEREFIKEHPLGHLVSGGVESRPNDPSKAAAYDKGLRGEQLDDDKE